MEIFLNRRKPRQRSIHLDCARRKTVFVFFVAFCQSRLAKSLGRDPKTNPPADFSPAGGNLFNVSSLGLDRNPEGRPDHWGQGCRPITSAPWRPWLPSVPSALSVKQFQVAPGSTTAARTCAANAAGTVRVMRDPETLTGIEYCKAGWPVSAGRRSMSSPLNVDPSHNAPT